MHVIPFLIENALLYQTDCAVLRFISKVGNMETLIEMVLLFQENLVTMLNPTRKKKLRERLRSLNSDKKN